jgi:hypothetical protein
LKRHGVWQKNFPTLLTFIPHLFACLPAFYFFAFSDSEDSMGRWELDKGVLGMGVVLDYVDWMERREE